MLLTAAGKLVVQHTLTCSSCLRRYHPKCIGLTKAACEAMKQFQCPECSSQVCMAWLFTYHRL